MPTDPAIEGENAPAPTAVAAPLTGFRTKNSRLALVTA